MSLSLSLQPTLLNSPPAAVQHPGTGRCLCHDRTMHQELHAFPGAACSTAVPIPRLQILWAPVTDMPLLAQHRDVGIWQGAYPLLQRCHWWQEPLHTASCPVLCPLHFPLRTTYVSPSPPRDKCLCPIPLLKWAETPSVSPCYNHPHCIAFAPPAVTPCPRRTVHPPATPARWHLYCLKGRRWHSASRAQALCLDALHVHSEPHSPHGVTHCALPHVFSSASGHEGFTPPCSPCR